MNDDSLAAADARALPAVARPGSRWLLPAGVAGVVLLGAATFAALYDPAATPGADALPMMLRINHPPGQVGLVLANRNSAAADDARTGQLDNAIFTGHVGQETLILRMVIG